MRLKFYRQCLLECEHELNEKIRLISFKTLVGLISLKILLVYYLTSWQWRQHDLCFILQKEIKGCLKMKKVEFTYPARQGVTVLKSFSISVVPGHTLALVGPSGSGKSSVISLIERFYDPTAGSILFDGTDIRELNISWYRHQIGLVSQEPVLFNISIGDNICYGANFRDVSDEEVIKSANIDEFIQSLPQISYQL